MAGSGALTPGWREVVTSETIESRLRYRPPLAMDPLMRFLSDRAIPGVESFDGATFRRAVRSPDGRPAVIGLRPRLDRNEVLLRVVADEVVEPSALMVTARRLFDLDADPTAIDTVLLADPVLRPLVRATPGIRVPGAADGFELAVRAILGQQVSVRAARTFAGRIAEASGTPLERPVDGITHLFPTAEQLAGSSLGSLGLTKARAATLQRVAELVAAGDLDLSGTTDGAATAERLLAVPGIGPWTVAYVSMRALRDPDAFPVGDLGVRLGFEALGLPSAPAAMREHADRWRPRRAYAVMHLWHGGHRGRDGARA
jgi:AraC family transcriptional regulator of adaptative response / DNA-3-methyladenine glycosylase II